MAQVERKCSETSFPYFSFWNVFTDVLAQIIANDAVCSVEEWKEIAETCLQSRRETLYKLLISVLAEQEGVVEIPIDDMEDAKLMDHIFL